MKLYLTPEKAEAWRSGTMGFREFFAATRDEWRSSAEWLLRRWRHVPTFVAREDVEQELLLGALKGLKEWHPSYGNPLHKHIRFAAVHGAMRWIHVQRNAKRRDGKAPGRWEIPFAAMSRRVDEDHDVTADSFPAPEPEREDFVEFDTEAEAERLAASQERRERLGIESLDEALEAARVVEDWISYAAQEGPEEAVESAALAVLGDPERACLLRVSDYRQARAAVLGCVRDFAESA